MSVHSDQLAEQCPVLQLFMLFLVHAYGSRVWRPPAAPLRTCQCSSKQDPTDLDHLWYLDGPWRLFWPVLIPWCCVEAVLTFSWTYAPKSSGGLAASAVYACRALQLAIAFVSYTCHSSINSTSDDLG